MSVSNYIRQQMIQQATVLKERIVNSSNQAEQQTSFWESRLIGKYVTVAQKYDSDDVDASIANWKYVEDFSRLSRIISHMTKIDSCNFL